MESNLSNETVLVSACRKVKKEETRTRVGKVFVRVPGFRHDVYNPVRRFPSAGQFFSTARYAHMPFSDSSI